MELFAKIVNGFHPLTIFAKNTILDIGQRSEDTSEFSDKNDNQNIKHCVKISHKVKVSGYSFDLFIVNNIKNEFSKNLLQMPMIEKVFQLKLCGFTASL